MKKELLNVLTILFVVISSLSGAEPNKQFFCRKKDGKLKLDGRIDEAVWQDKMVVVRFYKSRKQGEPKYQTEVYAMRDDENLYIAAKMYDEDIVANYTRRDDPIFDEDAFEVFIRPDLSKNFIFEFEFSPAGVIFDALDRRGLPNSSGYRTVTRKAWNGTGIECKTYIAGTLNDWSDKDKYWSVEIKIPLRNFTFRKIAEMPEKGSRWGIVFARCESSAYLEQVEYSASIPLSRYGVWENYSEWIIMELHQEDSL
ncbi:MAG: carbohydrate-binding family 9-like protein [Victivallaceae bacterium]|nr:carbohydrate-binding family 9-like protein [Victivallaceae bacterium]